MSFHARALLTIVTEALLEKDLIELFKAQQIRGWTITPARGKGTRGEKHGTFDANENIRIEVVAQANILESLSGLIQEKFGSDYALVQWVSDVKVLRGEKF